MFPALTATVLLLLAGHPLGRLAGLDRATAAAAAGPLALGVAGAGGWAAAALGLRWGPAAFAATWVAAAAVLLAARRIPGANPPPAGPGARPGRAAAMAAVVAAATAVAAGRVAVALAGVRHGAANPWETWDLQWHVNLLRYARETGSVSPLGVGALLNVESADASFYPAGWNALAALVPAAPAVTANVFGLVAPWLILPAGVALLAARLTGAHRAAPAAGAAAVLSLLPPELTLALPGTGSLPYLLAVAALPATIALVLAGRVPAAALAGAGVVLAHPAAGLVLALAAVLAWLNRPSRAGLVRLGALGAAGAALAWPIPVGAAGQAATVAGFTGQTELGRAESALWTVTGMSVRTEAVGWSPVLVAAALVGLVLLAARGTWWPAALAVLLGAAADSAQVRWPEPAGSLLRGIGVFFYDLPYRIQAPLGLLRVAAAAAAVAAVAPPAAAALARLRPGAGRHVPGPAVAAAAAMVALVPAAWSSAAAARAGVTTGRGAVLLPDSELAAWSWLAGLPHAREGLILNDRDEASGWMYAREGLPALFRHSSGPDGRWPDSRLVWDAADLAGLGGEVDAALARLGVRYVFSSPPPNGISARAGLALRSWAWWSPGLTPVHDDGVNVIFAVDAAFAPGEVDRILADSPHPPAPPDPAWRPPRQPILPPAGTPDPLPGATVAVLAAPGASAAARDVARRVAGQLRARGARVTADPAAAAAGARVVIGDHAGGAGGSRSATGFRVSAPAGDDASILLAAGVRDGVALGPLAPRIADGVVSGLAPGAPDAPADPGAAGAVLVDLGARDQHRVAELLADPGVREGAARGVVLGIAATLRQLSGAAPRSFPAPAPLAAGPAAEAPGTR